MKKTPRPFTQEEIDIIADRMRMGHVASDVAFDLDRSTDSIRTKWHQIRRSLEGEEMRRLHRLAIGL